MYAQGEEAVVALVEGLLERIERLEERIELLESKASKTSRNSSKPPSGDGFGKKVRSLRRKSEKKSGGQEGHSGSTLELSQEIDKTLKHEVSQCATCGASLEGEEVKDTWSRQVHDLPEIKLEVTEHVVEVKDCPQCGQRNEGAFPEGVNSVVQYGPRLKGLLVYLSEGQLLPMERTCGLMSDVMGAGVCEGTLQNSREECYEKLEEIESKIAEAVIESAVVNFDETGARVNGKLWWLHVASTSGLTYYFIHQKRGTAAMDEMGVLPDFKGKAVHDHWKSYYGYKACEHFLCNAHHLRELQFILESYQQSWAFQMSLLLVTILRQVQAARNEKQTALAVEHRLAFENRYLAIVNQGFADNPTVIPETPPDTPKKRGRPKCSPPQNLLKRLREHQASILGFMYDFSVPFDNNQAERDIRMMKLKQKISGTFRSTKGAQIFCRIRGYISTLRKQGHNPLQALTALFSGNPSPLILQPE